MYRVLHLDPHGYSETAKNRIRSVALLDEGPMDRKTLVSEIHKYHGVILRFGNKIDSEIISHAKNLRVIATNTTGTDHIDTTAAASANVSVISLKGEYKFLSTISSTAELTWGLILCLLRNIPASIADVHRSLWRRDLFVGRDLTGRRLGILGFGRIGKMVSRYGQAFFMEVKFYDSDVEGGAEGIERLSSIEQLFSWSDILTIHLPLNEVTQGIVSGSLIERLRPSSYLINTSRGAILNEEDLLHCLTTKKIAGAALDVLSGELDKDFPFNSKLVNYSKNNSNLLISPHIGGASYDAWQKTEDFICEKVALFFESLKS